MPAWLMRLAWKARGKRRVRLHLRGDDPSVEGILLGRYAGHYVLLTATMLEDEDTSVPLDGTVEVPAGNVVFVQVLR